MKLSIALAIILTSFIATADEVVHPPLNTETLIGTWEALSSQHPADLWHMEINKEGDSYLAQITVGTPCIVRRLISSEVKDGNIKLHFGNGSSKEMPNDISPEIWVVGTGSGVPAAGVIECRFCDNPSCALKNYIYFIKGTWTRDVAEASKKAEESIKAAALKH